MQLQEKQTNFMKVTQEIVFGVIGVLVMIFVLAILLTVLSPLILAQIPDLQVIIGDTVNLTEWFQNGGYFYIFIAIVIVLVIIAFAVGLIFYALRGMKMKK